MDIRRLLNVAYSHLTRDLPKAKRDEVDAQLAEKFPYEMDQRELRSLEYRRKAAELGIDLSAQRDVMDAFKLAPGTAR